MLRKLSLVGAAVLLALVLAGTASADNIAPNPGFEDDCAGVPCAWGLKRGRVFRDTDVAHDGLASLRSEYVDYQYFAAWTTNCITISAGDRFNVSFWYRTTAQEINRATLFIHYFRPNQCHQYRAATDTVAASTVLRDGLWHQVSGTITRGYAGDGFVTVEVEGHCMIAACSTTTTKINFDDVLVEPPPTAVTLRAFSARRERDAVLLSWRTASEVAALGFNVYRQERGKLLRLNPSLVPSVFGGTASGHAYAWRDRSGTRQPGAVRYRLQAVELGGSRRWLTATTLR